MLASGEVDAVTLVYNHFAGVMSQVPTELRLVPMAMEDAKVDPNERAL